MNDPLSVFASFYFYFGYGTQPRRSRLGLPDLAKVV